MDSAYLENTTKTCGTNMILIQIVTLVAIATIIGVVVWFAMQQSATVCTTNYCTQDCNQSRNCDCTTQPINENWPFPTQPKP